MRVGRDAVLAAVLATILAVPVCTAGARAACPEQAFLDAPPLVAAVGRGEARLNFVADADLKPGCPDATAACRRAAFVVPGDVVLLAAGQADGAEWTCAAFVNTVGVASMGLLPMAGLVRAADPPGGATGWIGHWVRTEATLDVAPAAPAGRLSVRGSATWGAADPVRVRSGGVNMGEVSGTAAPDASGVLAFTDGAGRTLPYDPADKTLCSIRMLRQGPYLVVKDNMGCGGMNVSFSGIYRRP